MNIKIGIISDVHHRDDILQLDWGSSSDLLDDQYRQFSTAEDRLQAAVDDANIAICGLFIQLGDAVDAHQSGWVGTTEEKNTATKDRLEECVTITDSFANDVAYVFGNHEGVCFGGGTHNDMSDYWAKIDAGSNHVTRENTFTESGDAAEGGYTFDYEGVRFVVVNTGYPATMSTAQLEWLYKDDLTGVLQVNMPCVILSHALLYPDNCQYAYGYTSNHEAIRDKLETAGNVALVLQGHFHRNEISGYGVNLHNVVNGITYLALRGSILGAVDGTVAEGATKDDSSHYIVEIKSLTVGGNGANVEVTGYKQGGSKAAEKYLIV